jgi:GNAT superfamily N-acetyltransferase/uncharacterized glyoxalase superfamily protein PhnB
MSDNEFSSSPILSHVEPVLAVRDVAATVSYWTEILGFKSKWTWGEPPNHGGVSWGETFIQFTLNPELAALSKGNCVWIRVRNLDALFDLHKNKNAEIVTPMQDQPWGMADYTVREINGYYVIFSAPSSPKQVSKKAPALIRIIERVPTVEEYKMLSISVGWGAERPDESIQKMLSAPIFAVVAEDLATNSVIGCVLLLGDGVGFYYIKDMMVHPNWQHQRVGTLLMKQLNEWIEINAPKNALVGLYTREGLAAFYQQFGFSAAFGMCKRM